jgi:hypothetical protein
MCVIFGSELYQTLRTETKKDAIGVFFDSVKQIRSSPVKRSRHGRLNDRRVSSWMRTMVAMAVYSALSRNLASVANGKSAHL